MGDDLISGVASELSPPGDMRWFLLEESRARTRWTVQRRESSLSLGQNCSPIKSFWLAERIPIDQAIHRLQQGEIGQSDYVRLKEIIDGILVTDTSDPVYKAYLEVKKTQHSN